MSLTISENKDSKKKIILLTTLIVSAVIALITLILMDFTRFGLPKIKELTGKGLIDSKIYYSGSELYEYLSNFNEDALNALLTVHAIDYVFMIAVCTFETALLLFLSKYDYKVLFVGACAFLELFFDISENLFVDFTIKKLPEKSSMISGLSGGMTLCKWIFTLIYIVSVIVFLCLIITKIRKSKKAVRETEEENYSSETLE